MSEMDKTAVIRTKKKDKPNEIVEWIVYDKTTKDSEIVKLTEDGWLLCAWGLPPCTWCSLLVWWRKGWARFLLPAISINTKQSESAGFWKSSNDLEAELQTLLEETKHD